MVVVGASVVTFVLIGAVASLLGGGSVEPADVPEVPETWTIWTNGDGIVSECLCDMAMATDGSIWISTADGTVTRYQPGTDPQSGSAVDIESRPFTDADWPPPAYPPITTAGG